MSETLNTLQIIMIKSVYNETQVFSTCCDIKKKVEPIFYSSARVWIKRPALETGGLPCRSSRGFESHLLYHLWRL